MNFEDWKISGPLLVRSTGLYFFVKTCEFCKSEFKLRSPGLLGDLASAASEVAEAYRDQALGVNPDPPKRPHRLDSQPNHLVDEMTRNGLLEKAPAILKCPEYFFISKQFVRQLKFGLLGAMRLRFDCLSGEVEMTVKGIPRGSLDEALSSGGWR
ncbi:MAG: hypothetical protein HY748_09030 [Elusimicrobia bacterium]|nr:hypothetical protein [Elusimicrobiota bacterium]